MRLRAIFVTAIAAPALLLGVVHGCSLYAEGTAVLDGGAVVDVATDQTVPCAPGFLDCDGDGVCESRDTDLQTCGACGTDCRRSAPAGETGFCVEAACVYCPAGRADCDGNRATKCETDVTNDPKDCGECGRSCMGGSCNAGTCGPLFLASVQGASDLTLVDGGVVVTANAQNAVYFIALGPDGQPVGVPEDGVLVPVAQGQNSANGPSSEGTHAYWATSAGVVHGALEDGGFTVRPLTNGGPATSTLVHGEHVYFIGQGNAAVLRADRSDGGVEEVSLEGNPPLTALTNNGATLYWADAMRAVRQAPAAADAGATSVGGLAPAAGVIALLGASGQLYALTRDPGSDGGKLFLRRLPEATPLVEHDSGTLGAPLAAPLHLTADKDYLYYSDTASGVVWRFPLPDVDGDAGAVATDQALLGGVAADDKALYWIVDGGVVRLAK